MYRSIVLDGVEQLHLTDGEGRLHHGADQEWYPLSWQRRAGCGPTTASQLLLYNSRSYPDLGLMAVADKDGMVALMEEVWTYITPGIMGVHLVSHFTKGLERYLADHDIDRTVISLAIPKEREARPSLDEVVSFITRSLQAGQPVAFLNLGSAGTVNLDSWHWVTVVGLFQVNEESPVMLTIYDAGMSFPIEFSTWYAATGRSSGFVSLA